MMFKVGKIAGGGVIVLHMARTYCGRRAVWQLVSAMVEC